MGKKNITEKVKLDIVGQYLGKKIIETHNLSKSFGDKKIVEKFSYSFINGEKVGIIGKNGVGKTTFLNLLMGLEQPDSGKVVHGETVKIGYYSQSGLEFGEDEKVIDSVKKIAQYIKLSDGKEITASKMLERFLFTPSAQQGQVSKLSGGEKKRLYLLKILMSNPNFLILDEPTNDFDILTLNVLEEFLQEFKGCVLIISHDRYFMDKIVDHLFVFHGEAKIQNFPGSYSDYRASITDAPINLQPGKAAKDPTPKANQGNQKGDSELYRQITKLEGKKDKLTQRMLQLNTDYAEIAKLANQIKELEAEIALKTEEWFELGGGN